MIVTSHTRTVSHRRVDRGPQQVFFSEFIEYFRDISPAIEDDKYFHDVALNSWIFRVKGNQGRSDYGNSGDSTCRALVTHPDGYQEVNKTGERIGLSCTRSRVLLSENESAEHIAALLSVCTNRLAYRAYQLVGGERGGTYVWHRKIGMPRWS